MHSLDRILALSPDDQNLMAQLLLQEPPLMVEIEREIRLTKEGLVERRHGQLVVTDKARALLGLSG